jgi:hypothetical protein
MRFILTEPDYKFLCQLAQENGVEPSAFAKQILVQRLDDYRDEIRYARLQDQKDLESDKDEKIFEEFFAIQKPC